MRALPCIMAILLSPVAFASQNKSLDNPDKITFSYFLNTEACGPMPEGCYSSGPTKTADIYLSDYVSDLKVGTWYTEFASQFEGDQDHHYRPQIKITKSLAQSKYVIEVSADILNDGSYTGAGSVFEVCPGKDLTAVTVYGALRNAPWDPTTKLRPKIAFWMHLPDFPVQTVCDLSPH